MVPAHLPWGPAPFLHILFLLLQKGGGGPGAWPAGNGAEVGWRGGTQGRAKTQLAACCSPVSPGGCGEMGLRGDTGVLMKDQHHGKFWGLDLRSRSTSGVLGALGRQEWTTEPDRG